MIITFDRNVIATNCAGLWIKSAYIRIDLFSFRVQVYCPNMQRLMDVTDEMRQQQERLTFIFKAERYRCRISFQDMYCCRNCSNDVVVTSSNVAGIVVVLLNGNVGIMILLVARFSTRFWRAVSVISSDIVA